MRRISLCTALLCALTTLAGCGTLLGRGSAEPPTNATYYKGTQSNLLLLGADGSSGEAHGNTVFCYLMIVCPLVTVATLPVDAAADTLLLPADYLGTR